MNQVHKKLEIIEEDKENRIHLNQKKNNSFILRNDQGYNVIQNIYPN